MNRTKKILLLLSISFLFLGLTNQRETIIKGTVKTENANKKNNVGLLQLELRENSLVKGQTIIQMDGTFIMRAKLDKDADLFYKGIGINGEVFIQTLQQTSSDTIFLTIEIPKNYTKKWGKAVCPKCNKQDQTLPIKYGLGSAILVRHIDKNRDTTYLPYNNKKYFDGNDITSDLDPKYFCKRDNIKF